MKIQEAPCSLKLQESIQNVVNAENLLLITNSNIPYKENACCNDKKTKTSLNYFEDNNKELLVYGKMISGWEQLLKQVKQS